MGPRYIRVPPRDRWRRRAGSTGVRAALSVLVVASAIGTAVIVALTGDAGARAVWGGR